MGLTDVTASVPKVGGAVYVAPITGTTLPTDATTALDANFVPLGYINEDGLTNNNSGSATKIRAWGGDIVLTKMEEKEDTFTFTLIEYTNTDVLKFIYGSGNVTGTLATGIKVTAKADEPEEVAIAIEEVLRDGTLQRTVLPRAKVSEVGEIKHADAELAGFETTVDALVDSTGATHYTYILKQ